MPANFDLPRLKPAKEIAPAAAPVCPVQEFDQLPIGKLSALAVRLESHPDYKKLCAEVVDPDVAAAIAREVFGFSIKSAPRSAIGSLVNFLRVLRAYRQVAGGRAKPLQQLIDKLVAMTPEAPKPERRVISLPLIPAPLPAGGFGQIETAPDDAKTDPAEWGRALRQRCGFAEEETTTR